MYCSVITFSSSRIPSDVASITVPSGQVGAVKIEGGNCPSNMVLTCSDRVYPKDNEKMGYNSAKCKTYVIDEDNGIFSIR